MQLASGSPASAVIDPLLRTVARAMSRLPGCAVYGLSPTFGKGIFLPRLRYRYLQSLGTTSVSVSEMNVSPLRTCAHKHTHTRTLGMIHRV